MANNVKLVLAGGRPVEYDEATISVEPGGVLKVIETTGYITYYAPTEWRTLGHAPTDPRSSVTSLLTWGNTMASCPQNLGEKLLPRVS